ncbi:hypothetical protein GQ43DRAFT_246754 [Delitschia confertaspora ATCC 74209]|uniref:Transmembrane protein n=1 Tax=Delitschia confertaspora ATCC 74209 TaxID=1513339 RepID=A0A9P4JV00_9PLEO|nr:hypothetical protein GQ43DRAFT_246754 [Delitschia confertaspora ATCC 74209]
MQKKTVLHNFTPNPSNSHLPISHLKQSRTYSFYFFKRYIVCLGPSDIGFIVLLCTITFAIMSLALPRCCLSVLLHLVPLFHLVLLRFVIGCGMLGYRLFCFPELISDYATFLARCV